MVPPAAGPSVSTLRQVVKAFSAEKYELGRYREAAARQQLAGRKGQTSMVSLRVVQSLIMRVAMCGVLFATALDVIEGTSSVGDFVAIQVVPSPQSNTVPCPQSNTAPSPQSTYQAPRSMALDRLAPSSHLSFAPTHPASLRCALARAAVTLSTVGVEWSAD
jgi:hypothetical protein